MGIQRSAPAVPYSRKRFQVPSMLIERGIPDSAPAVQHSCAQSLTGAPTVPYSRSRFQVTSVLIEQGILVLPHSRTPTVDVSISFANRTTGGLREQFFSVRYLVGRPFCNLAVFLDSGWQSIQVSNPPPLAQQFGTLPTQPTIHKTPHS